MCLKPICIMLLVTLLLLGCSSSPPKSNGWVEYGKASYYASSYQSMLTASGERYDESLLTAAHKRLPFGTRVVVTNVNNGDRVVVRINDRGPFVSGRVIDLSKTAFQRIGDLNAGLLDVKLELVQ